MVSALVFVCEALKRNGVFIWAGDYTDPGVALWSTRTYHLLSSVGLPQPLQDLGFSPFSSSQLACVGSAGALFCLIESEGLDVQLKVIITQKSLLNKI